MVIWCLVVTFGAIRLIMSRILLFFVAIFGTTFQNSFSQKTAIPTSVKGIGLLWGNKSITDTLWNGFKGYTPTVYESPNGGFLSGNNGYGDVAKGQIFPLIESIHVSGAIFWFAYKAQNATGSAVSFKYHITDTIIPGNVPLNVPNTLLDSITVNLDNIPADTTFENGAFIWIFDSPIATFDNYCFSVFFDELNDGDTLALFNSTDGQTIFQNRSIEFWNGRWRSILNNWDVDVDFAIFPLVDSTNVGVFENNLLRSFTTFPNPFVDQINLKIDNAQMPIGQNMLIEIFDLNGQKVHTEYTQFEDNISISIQNLKPGVYFLRLNGNSLSSRRIIKKE